MVKNLNYINVSNINYNDFFGKYLISVMEVQLQSVPVVKYTKDDYCETTEIHSVATTEPKYIAVCDTEEEVAVFIADKKKIENSFKEEGDIKLIYHYDFIE